MKAQLRTKSSPVLRGFLGWGASASAVREKLCLARRISLRMVF